VLEALVVELVVVDEVSELSRRFIVGRSGSSAGAGLDWVLAVLAVLGEVEAGVVLELVEVLVLSRRFMVGRSGSVLSVVDFAVSLAELWRTGSVLEGLRATTVFFGTTRGLTLP
jgi:hypothetical protein